MIVGLHAELLGIETEEQKNISPQQLWQEAPAVNLAMH